MIKIDGHDNAIIGVSSIWKTGSTIEVLVYEAETIRDNLMRDGMDFFEAEEWISFNIQGAYMGENTPILVWTQEAWDNEGFHNRQQE